MVELSPAGIHHFFQEYGNIGIFVLLALGIIGLPVPDETLLVITGLLLAKAHMPIDTTLVAIYTGSMCGITISYLIGLMLGKPLLFRFGSKIGITHEKLEKAHAFAEKYGTWSLLFGYFIPGVRHVFGIAAGVTHLAYRKFALFAYTGACLWASIFLSIGYFFYNEWQHISTWFG